MTRRAERAGESQGSGRYGERGKGGNGEAVKTAAQR